MSMNSKYLPLGTPVRIMGYVHKTSDIRMYGQQLTNVSSWEPVPRPPSTARRTLETGIIVGVRTLSSCDAEITEAEGIQVRRTYDHFQAYLVAPDLYRAPVRCTLDQVQPLDVEEAAA